jgi:glycine/D-amino acid oxidase-like deaminating enzyme
MAESILKAKQAMNASKSKAVAQLSALAAQRVDVVVVGAGITGAQSVYNLLSLATGPTSIVLIDSGELGAGSHDRFKAAPQVPLNATGPYQVRAAGRGQDF